MVKAGRVLAARGYQTNRGAEAGILTTDTKQRPVTPAQAGCDTTMGIDYLDDKRSTTRVGYSLIAGASEVAVKAIVEGEYKPGSVNQDITLTSVSRGALERELASDL